MSEETFKKEIQLLLVSLEDALPYIAKPTEIRNIVNEILEKTALIGCIIRYLERKMIEVENLEIKTDIKILVNALKKRAKGEKHGA